MQRQGTAKLEGRRKGRSPSRKDYTNPGGVGSIDIVLKCKEGGWNGDLPPKIQQKVDKM